jgi:biopolymer transport protein ExbD
MPVEQIEARLRETMRQAYIGPESAEIRVVEGSPFEHVEKVLAMFRSLGMESPGMTTIPPERDVVVELDAEGKATVDGAAVEDPHAALQEIANKYGSRAKVVIRAHPQCPADAVVQITASCRQLGFGKVNVGAAEQAEAPE